MKIPKAIVKILIVGASLFVLVTLIVPIFHNIFNIGNVFGIILCVGIIAVTVFWSKIIELCKHLSKSKRGRKFAYKINFSQSVQICRKFLRNKIKCRDVIELIEKFILPIRGGKDHPRTNSPRREIYFNFRLA